VIDRVWINNYYKLTFEYIIYSIVEPPSLSLSQHIIKRMIVYYDFELKWFTFAVQTHVKLPI